MIKINPNDIESFHFIIILRKDPLIFLLQHLEGHVAIGAHDQLPRLLVAFQRDISVTDGTFQNRLHGSSPSVFLRTLRTILTLSCNILNFFLALEPYIFENIKKMHRMKKGMAIVGSLK